MILLYGYLKTGPQHFSSAFAMVTKVTADPQKEARASHLRQKTPTSLASATSKGSLPPAPSLALKKCSLNDVLGKAAPLGTTKAHDNAMDMVFEEPTPAPATANTSFPEDVIYIDTSFTKHVSTPPSKPPNKVVDAPALSSAAPKGGLLPGYCNNFSRCLISSRPQASS